MKKQSFPFKIDPKYYNAHNNLTFCNDVFVSILHYADKTHLTQIQIPFNSEADYETFNSQDDDSWQDWLLQNGYRDLMYDAYYKHTFFSLLTDFCNFTLESINCAAKMKVSIAYALLRKPFKDTLGYFEWLVIDKNEFIDLLLNDNPEKLQIFKPKAKEHTSIIEQRYGIPTYFDFRYDKSNTYSLEHIWNNASHIITTKYPLSKTQKGNLNFIFSDTENLNELIDYYYSVVPNIMLYALQIICMVFESFAPLKEYTLAVNSLNRLLKMSTFSDLVPFSEVLEIFDKNKLPIICPRCGLNIKMTDKRLDNFKNTHLICPRCLKKINTTMYIFDWEKSRHA